MKRTPVPIMLVSAVLGWGCGSEPAETTALDVLLVPDRNLNSQIQIVESIDTLQVILDSPEGLYPPGSEFVSGNMEIRDADDDPTDLELVVTFPVPLGKLPSIRIERGGLPDVPLDIRFIGFHSTNPGERKAEGRVRGIRFDPDRITSLPVAFNLRPDILPPRVTEILPADDSFLDPCRVDTIVVVFSKPMDGQSVQRPGNFRVDGDNPASIVVDPSGFIATYTMGELDIRQTDLSYRVTISTDVKSRDGVALDQVAAEPGPQPYSARFTMRCNFQETALQPVVCSEQNPDGNCPGAGRFRCDQGACVPVNCDASQCAEGFVCDPSTWLCEVDCRAYGDVQVCPDSRPNCDQSTGVCLE